MLPGDDLISSDADTNKKPSMFELDQYQKSRRPDTPLASAAASAVVEIPAPNKHLEARHYDNDAEDMPNRPKFRPRSYVSHLLNLFGLSKRGGGGGHRN